MTFTFSNNQAVDYPALGMCDTCGKRFTQGCEHSNTLEAQQWLAAYLAVEQNRENVDYCIRIMEETRPHPVNEAEFVDGFCDPRTPEEKEADLFAQEVEYTRLKDWDVTPTPNMPIIDFDNIDEIPF